MVRSRGEGTTRVKLIRTIRLDPSDTFVFEKAAEPGEWAVSGAFAFWSRDPAMLEGKSTHGVPQRFSWNFDARVVDARSDC